MTKTDQWSRLALLILAGFICWGASSLPYGGIRSPGPGFFPLWLGILLGTMSLGLLARASLRTQGVKRMREFAAEKIRWGKVLLVLAVLILYGAGMGLLGFLLISFLFLLVLIRFVDPQSWRSALGWALVGSVASYMVFELWLKLRLPKGILGI